MNGDMKMELHFVCNLAFIFASLSVTKYIMKVCHSLFVESYDEVFVEISSARLCHLLFAKYHPRDFATYYLRNIICETLSLIICEISITYYLRKSVESIC